MDVKRSEFFVLIFCECVLGGQLIKCRDRSIQVLLELALADQAGKNVGGSIIVLACLLYLPKLLLEVMYPGEPGFVCLSPECLLLLVLGYLCFGSAALGAKLEEIGTDTLAGCR